MEFNWISFPENEGISVYIGSDNSYYRNRIEMNL